MFSCYHKLLVFFSSSFLSFSSFLSPLLLPDVNRHRCGQERPDLFCWWHHNQKGGPERHPLHFPWFQRLDISSPLDMWQQHGHQSGDLYTQVPEQLLTAPVCSQQVAAPPCAPHPSNPYLVFSPMTHHWYAALYNCIYYIRSITHLFMNDNLSGLLVFEWEQDMQGLFFVDLPHRLCY